jgi:Na+/proline symporter
MKSLKIIVIILTFSLSSNIYAYTTSCGSGECPVLERAKDVGDAALKEMAPYIGAAIVIGLAASSGSAADSYINNIDKSPFQGGI